MPSNNASGMSVPQDGGHSVTPAIEQDEHRKAIPRPTSIALIKPQQTDILGNSPSSFTLVVKSRRGEKLRETKWEPNQGGWPVGIVHVQGSLKTENLSIQLRKDRLGGYHPPIASGQLTLTGVEEAIHESHNHFEIFLDIHSRNTSSVNNGRLALIVEISTASLFPVWINSMTFLELPDGVMNKTLESLDLIFRSGNGEVLRESSWNSSHKLWDVGLPQLRGSGTERLSIELLRKRRLGIARESLATVMLSLEELEQARKVSKKEITKDFTLPPGNKLNVEKLILVIHIGALKMPLIDTRRFTFPPLVRQLLENISIVTGVMDALSELHPAAQLAWLVASVPLQLLQDKKKLDDELEDLVLTMSQVYTCATVKDDPLRSYETFRQIFDNMIQESIECFLFIHNYISDGHFRYMNDTSSKVAEFTQTFQRLQSHLLKEQLNTTTATVLKTKDMVSNVSESSQHTLIDNNSEVLRLETRLRKELGGNVDFQLPSEQGRCLPGTRERTLAKIFTWGSTGKESLFWLSGIAGSGKSTVMATMHNYLAQTGRYVGHSGHLAAYLRFHRVSFPSPSNFVKALAYRLAIFDKDLGREIARGVDDQPAIFQQSLAVQLESLVAQPLDRYRTGMKVKRRMFVMVDGLDECMEEAGGSDAFHELLAVLSQLASHSTLERFPFLRFIVASRPEEPIRTAFTQSSNGDDDTYHPNILHLRLDTSSPETTADILKYLIARFEKIFQKNHSFRQLCQQENAISRLAESSHGLFIWATVVVRFLQLAQNRDRLQLALDIAIPKDASAFDVLSKLYSTVLHSVAAEHSDEDIRSQIRYILGVVIAVGRLRVLGGCFLPGLTENILHGLLKHLTDKVDDILSLLPKLGAVMEGVHSHNAELVLLHKSFEDYLTDSSPGNPWCIDVEGDWIPKVADCCIQMVHLNVFGNTPDISDGSSFALQYWIFAFLEQLESDYRFTADHPLFCSFLEILQQGFLRWVHCIHAQKRAGLLVDLDSTYYGLQWMLDIDHTPEIVGEVVSIFEWHPSKFGIFNLSADLQIIFLCLFLHSEYLPTLRKYYLPQFCNMASGSRDFFIILKAIDSVAGDSTVLLDRLRPTDASEHESDEDSMGLQITGIPSVVTLEEMSWELGIRGRLNLSHWRLRTELEEWFWVWC